MQEVIQVAYLVDDDGRVWDWKKANPCIDRRVPIDLGSEVRGATLPCHRNSRKVVPYPLINDPAVPAGPPPATCNACGDPNEYGAHANYPASAPVSFRCGQCRAHCGG